MQKKQEGECDSVPGCSVVELSRTGSRINEKSGKIFIKKRDNYKIKKRRGGFEDRGQKMLLSSTTFLPPSGPMGPPPGVYKAVFQSCPAHSQVELNKPFPLL